MVFGAAPDTPRPLAAAFSMPALPLVGSPWSVPPLAGRSLARTDCSSLVAVAAGASALDALAVTLCGADCVMAGGGVAVVVACLTPTPAPTPATITAAPAAALPQPLCTWSESIGRCCMNAAPRPLGGGAAASALSLLLRSFAKIGNGRMPATLFATRSRTLGRVNSSRSSPAASASRRHGWQCER